MTPRSVCRRNGSAESCHIWIYGDGIRLVSAEGFGRILLGRTADVAALGIQNHWNLGTDPADVLDVASSCCSAEIAAK